MSQHIPFSLQNFGEKSITRLFQGNKNGADSTAPTSRTNGGHLEMDEFHGDSVRIDESLQVHSNTVLKATENLACCGCQKRWQLAILANLGFLIVFGIRCNFGAAKNHMSRDFVDPWGHKHKHQFNWTSTELGVMESSFFYGYLVTQVPAGFLAAKFAANKMFGLAIGGASFLNLLLPLAFNSRSDTMVAFVQILQGLIQGLAYPAMHGVWRYWAPPLERSKLATTAFTGSYAGAVFGMPLSAFLVSYVSWSAPFYVYGVAGVIWTIFWFSMTFEKPAFHPTITIVEKKYIEDQIGHVSQTHPTFHTVPWKAILTSKPVYAIIVANFARSWNFYLLLQNQLTYMRDVLDLRINDSGLIAAIPHAVMGAVVLLGGRLADYLRSNKILSTTAVRKLFNCGGFGCEALFLLVVAYTRSERTAVMAMIIAVGCSGFAISGYNVNHLDIAPRYAAILMGFSNGIGTLAGLTCPFVVEMLTASGRRNGWVTVFLLASLIHFTGITFYAVYASGELQDWAEPKDEDEPFVPKTQVKEVPRRPSKPAIPPKYGTTTTTNNSVSNSQQPINLSQPFYNAAWDDAGASAYHNSNQYQQPQQQQQYLPYHEQNTQPYIDANPFVQPTYQPQQQPLSYAQLQAYSMPETNAFTSARNDNYQY